MAVLARYLDYDIPPAGCGNSAHGRILGKADLGIIAGLTPDEIFADIRANIPPGKRRVSDKEIWDAIHKAFSDHTDGCFVPVPKPKPIVNDSRAVLSKLIEQGRGASEESIREASPIPIDSECMTISILQSLSHGEDPLFIGEREQPGIVGETIRTAREWIEDLSKGARPGPHIIPNPLSGVPAPKKSGDGETFRGDGNVATFRFCVAEFDNLSREDQLSFWAAVDLPIVALIDSAGKSLHAWLSVPKLAHVQTAEEWDRHIRGRLYAQILVPLGCDSACSNPSRLSRLPGHFRAEKGRMQRLLFLSPSGRRIF